MKKLAGILLAVCMMLSLSVSAFASSLTETTGLGSVVIGATIPDTHTISVNADSADIFIEGISDILFTVDRMSEPRLLIRPKANKVVTQVLVNGNDVSGEISGGYLSLPPIHEDLQLTVMTADADAPKDGTFTLQGVVISDGKPLPGITLELHSNPQTTVTDESGAFRFALVEYGHHTLTAIQNGSAIGYCEFWADQGANAAIDNNAAENYILSLPQTAEGITLTLNLANDGKIQPTDIKEIEKTQNSPQTGDNSNVSLPIILIFASGSMVILLSVFRKRKKS